MRNLGSRGILSALLTLLSGLAIANGPTDLYFVRHGETVANATGRYNSHTLNEFSDKGTMQVRSLVYRLRNTLIDAAICSPSPRALKTAIGVLQEQGLRAEIWPEFNECCTQAKKLRKIPPHYDSLRTVGPIRVPASMARHFSVEPGHDQMIFDGNYQDGLVVTREAVRRFKQRFSGSGKHILIVGHSGQGGVFLEMLLGKQTRKISIGNTSIYHLRETGGKWTLISVSNYKG